MMLNFRSCFYKYKWLICRILVSTFFGVVFISLVPYMSKILIEQYTALSWRKTALFSLFYLLSVVFFLLFEYWKKLSYNKLQQIYGLDMRSNLFGLFTLLEHHDFNQHDNGTYLNALLKDLENIYVNYVLSYIQLAASLLSVIVYLSYMLYLNSILAISLFIICLLALYLPQKLGKKLSYQRRQFSDAEGYFIEAINDLLNVQELYSKHSAKRFQQIFMQYNQSFENSQLSFVNQLAKTNIISGSSLYLINIAGFILGVCLVNMKVMSIANLIAMFAFVELIAVPTRDMIYQLVNINSSHALIQKLDKLTKQTKEKREKIIDFNLLTIHDLTYTQHNFTLKKLNFSFQKGGKYLIIGSNGSGKSTLLKLLAGNLITESGIYLDNQPLNASQTDELIYYASKSVVFRGSVDSNVRISNKANKINASAYAIVADLIERECDFGGSNFSLGERARIALARAINSEKPILMLDEIFANIDTAKERALTKILLDTPHTLLLISQNQSADYTALFDGVIRL